MQGRKRQVAGVEFHDFHIALGIGFLPLAPRLITLNGAEKTLGCGGKNEVGGTVRGLGN